MRFKNGPSHMPPNNSSLSHPRSSILEDQIHESDGWWWNSDFVLGKLPASVITRRFPKNCDFFPTATQEWVWVWWASCLPRIDGWFPLGKRNFHSRSGKQLLDMQMIFFCAAWHQSIWSLSRSGQSGQSLGKKGWENKSRRKRENRQF